MYEFYYVHLFSLNLNCTFSEINSLNFCDQNDTLHDQDTFINLLQRKKIASLICAVCQFPSKMAKTSIFRGFLKMIAIFCYKGVKRSVMKATTIVKILFVVIAVFCQTLDCEKFGQFRVLKRFEFILLT